MQLVFQCDESGPLFTTRELVVQSLKLSYHKIATVTPNAMLTQATVVYDDKRKSNLVHKINELAVHDQPEHL